MTRFALLILCLFNAANAAGNVVEVAPQRTQPGAPIKWLDEAGRVRALTEFSGYPLVLLPIYTRCPGPCFRNVDQLKAALANSSSDPRRFRVLLFSFDPTDNAGSLSQYRQRENIPLGWSTGSASQKDTDALLESVGVQVGKAGTEFTHPNIVIFLDSKLRIAKWIYGTDYSSTDVDSALKVAGGESDWIGEHSQLLYAMLLFAGSLLCVALCYSLTQLRSARRSGHTTDSIRPVVSEH